MHHIDETTGRAAAMYAGRRRRDRQPSVPSTETTTAMNDLISVMIEAFEDHKRAERATYEAIQAVIGSLPEPPAMTSSPNPPPTEFGGMGVVYHGVPYRLEFKYAAAQGLILRPTGIEITKLRPLDTVPASDGG